MLSTVFYSGEADWVGNVVDFKVLIIFSPAVLHGVNEEKVKFTHDNSFSHLHYQSSFLCSILCFTYCVFIVIFTDEVLDSTNSYAQIYSQMALTDVLWKPQMLWLKMLPAGRPLPSPDRGASSACTSVHFPHLNSCHFGWLELMHRLRMWFWGLGTEHAPSCCPFLEAACPWQRGDRAPGVSIILKPLRYQKLVYETPLCVRLNMF